MPPTPDTPIRQRRSISSTRSGKTDERCWRVRAFDSDRMISSPVSTMMYHATATPSSPCPRIVAMAVMLLAAAWMPEIVRAGSPEATPVEADQVKAGFVLNFARFVQWPSTLSGPLSIGVVADDAFAAVLERVIRDRTVEGHALVVRRVRDGDDPSGCHLLFISASSRGR